MQLGEVVVMAFEAEQIGGTEALSFLNGTKELSDDGDAGGRCCCRHKKDNRVDMVRKLNHTKE
jgi:hypothetical protein